MKRFCIALLFLAAAVAAEVRTGDVKEKGEHHCSPFPSAGDFATPQLQTQLKAVFKGTTKSLACNVLLSFPLRRESAHEKEA